MISPDRFPTGSPWFRGTSRVTGSHQFPPLQGGPDREPLDAGTQIPPPIPPSAWPWPTSPWFAAWMAHDDARRAATMAAGKRRLAQRHKDAATSCGLGSPGRADTGAAL
jgi:hypothetical protein